MVEDGDYIYGWHDEFASPVVIEKYKLIFFLVPGVEEKMWVRLFRRMMGYDDWLNSTSHDGLVRLYNYSISQASELMASPSYVRAIFVRDPKQRICAAYENVDVKNRCCAHSSNKKSCSQMLSHFGQFLDLIHTCDQPHWRPQGKRMEPKYFNTINFVGHMETMQKDAQRLLKLIGAWDKFGREGWSSGIENSEIFADASFKVTKPCHFPGMMKCYGEVGVDYFYRSDYRNQKLNLKINHGQGCQGLPDSY